jgi:hypothetical protein
MNAIGIIYFHYWLNFQAKETFQEHLTLLKAQFCFETSLAQKMSK